MSPSQELSASRNRAWLNRQTAERSEGSLTVGWREWIALPELGLHAIKAKVDTGARTSAIHAFDIERIPGDDGRDWIAFSIHPVQRNKTIIRRCQAPLIDIRRVTDSGGHTEDRFFISSTLQIGPVRRAIELTLSQRDNMLFRMLLGRTALVPDILVDSSKSFTFGRVSARLLYADNVAEVSA